MQTQARFIGEAAAQLHRRDLQNEVLPIHVTPELIHMNDVVRHPPFPREALYVVGREVDLIARTVTIVLDLLPRVARRRARLAPSRLPIWTVELVRHLYITMSVFSTRVAEPLDVERKEIIREK
jgi:hypothetical protein